MTTIIDALQLGAAEWLAWALDVSVKGSVVLALAALGAHLARHRSAAARHAIWSLAIAAVLALPVLQLVLPAWEVPLLQSPRATFGIVAEIPRAPAPPRVADRATLTHAADSRVAGVAASAAEHEVVNVETRVEGRDAIAVAILTRHEWAGVLWAAGALLVLLRIAAGTFGVWLISRRATPVLEGDWLALAARLARRLGVTRPITLLRSDRASVPVTWGVVYPVVLLPSETTDWGDARRAAVLLHELAHVRRFDALTQTVAQLAFAIHWFNPLVWVAVRRMRAERERACDDAVLGAGARASVYAEDLLDIVRSLGREPGPAFAALAMARRSELEGRLLAILDPRTARGTVGGRSTAGLVALALLLVAPLAAMRAVPAEARAKVKAGAATEVVRGAQVARGSAANGGAAASGTTSGGAAPDVALWGPSLIAGYDSIAARRSSIAADAERDATGMPLPCRLNSLIRDDEPYSSARAEKMWFSGTDDRCLGATYRGALRLSEARDDVRAIGAGGFLVVVDVRPALRRRVEFVPGADGGVRRTYYEGARRVPMDDADVRWLGDVLRELFARDGGAAMAPPPAPDAPVAPATLAAPAPTRPVYGALTPEDARETLILAARSVGSMSSDGAKARLLSDVAARYRPDDSLRAVYLRSARTIVSDGSKTFALEALLRRDSLDGRAAAAYANAAREIVSNGDRTRLLVAVARTAPLADADARRAYFRAAGEIVGEADRRRTMLAALQANPGSRDVALAVLRGAVSFVSGRERAEVLLAAADRASFADAEVRRAFFAALEGMSSDTEYRRVMAAVMK